MLSLEIDLKNTQPIKNIQQMWDAVIQHHKEGSFDTDAMYDIYKRMDARLTYSDIANVFSGVYAGNYWSDTLYKMDPTILAEHMKKGLGLDYNRALSCATSAMSQWRGILLRKIYTDAGQIPEKESYTASVDIVCNQDNPLDTDQLITDWNNEFWETPKVGKNYVYIRCQNLNFQGAIKPQVRVFYSDAGFATPPSSWIQMYTVNGSKALGDVMLLGGESGSMELGIRGASEAFNFAPTAAKHYCIVASFASEFFDNNPLENVSSNWSSATWIKYNGAVGWHNVDPQKSIESTLKFYNLDGRPEKFAFEAYCKNVPKGTVITLKSKDSQFADLNSGSVEISQQYQLVATEAIVPSNHQGELEVLINTPDGKLLPEGALVEVRMVWLLDHTHDQYFNAADMMDANPDARELRNIRIPMGSFTFVGTSN
jgi:hypothetical protein